MLSQVAMPQLFGGDALHVDRNQVASAESAVRRDILFPYDEESGLHVLISADQRK